VSGARRVLVVEDDALAAQTVMRVLAKAGLDGRSARTAADARAQAASWKPDVILIDRHLPDGDGVSLARALKSGGKPRLVMMSGDPLEGSEGGAFDAWLLKPVSMQELLASLGG